MLFNSGGKIRVQTRVVMKWTYTSTINRACYFDYDQSLLSGCRLLKYSGSSQEV